MGNALRSFQDDLAFLVHGYDFDQESGVWTNRAHPALSDDERRLVEGLRAISDRSTWSAEVAKLWRASPIAGRLGFGQHLPISSIGIDGIESVLCVGTHLGGLGRWLGEQNINVTLVTDSFSEAALAAARCCDIPRVKVMAGPVRDFAAVDLPELGILNLGSAALSETDSQQLLEELAARLSQTATLLVIADNPAHGLWSGRQVATNNDALVTPSLDVWNDMLRSSGFPHVDWSACYPSPAMTLSVVQEKAFVTNPELVRGLVRYGLSHSLAGLQPLSQEFAPLVERGVGMRVAPGWVGIAHKHRVHRILQRGEVAHRFIFDAGKCEIARDDWRSGAKADQPSGRVVIANPERQVVLSWSEAFPTFRTVNVVRHELGRVHHELARVRELLRNRIAEQERKEKAYQLAIEDAKKTTSMLSSRIELLVRSEERTIRLLASSKEEIQYLEGQCERLEKRRDELMELTAAMSSSIRILSQPRYEPSVMARIKRGLATVWNGMY